MPLINAAQHWDISHVAYRNLHPGIIQVLQSIIFLSILAEVEIIP
jgi:hypothetical protein